MRLVRPAARHLPEYVAAMQAGWSPSTTRDVTAAQLAAIAADPAAFLVEVSGRGRSPITLDDGRVVPRLPGPTFWIWDQAFCGSINLRYTPGTEDLPPHVSGHVGYTIVPWMRRRGYATGALRLLLPVAARLGLPRLLLTCDTGNVVSRRVIEANGGVAAGQAGGKLLFWVGTVPGAIADGRPSEVKSG